MENTEIRKELQEALTNVSRAYGIIKGFSSEYHTIWVVDKVTLQMYLIRSTGVSTIQNAVQMGKDYPDFDTGFDKYISTYVEPEDRERMRREIASKEVLRQLEKEDTYSVNYLRRDDAGHVGYHQITFANADTEDGQKQFVYGFRDIDKLIKEDQEQKKALREAKQLAEDRSEKLAVQLEIINSLTKVYNSIYYVNLEDFSFIQLAVNMDGVENVIGNSGDARESFEQMYRYLVIPEDVKSIKKFTDLTTIAKRLQTRDWISQEFRSTVGGWSEGVFIAADRDFDGRLNHVIWATRDIDAIKRKEETLTYQSNTDELTGFYNRRAYEDAISVYDTKKPEKNFVYISMDVNGLKTVNDTIGHAAGDELIVGAAECMKQCFGTYGKLFRTGGDEFCGLVFASEKQLEQMKQDIETTTAEWTGELIDSLSISCGYVPAKEAEGLTMHEIAVLADKRMYEAKSDYYRSKGVDRRGQKDAHIALCGLYVKILKINITNDTYEVIDLNHTEKTAEGAPPKSISGWLTEFGTTGQVYPDDLDNYMEKTNLAYLSEYFKNGNTMLSILYRRKYEDGFKQTLMEIIPANDYSDDMQTLFLYVKNIEG